MPYKKILFWGIATALGSALACIIWDRIYHFAMMTDFTKIINPISILASNLIAGICISAGYWIFQKWKLRNNDFVFNALLSILSLVSITMPLSISLPLDVQFPELFLGLTAPMHIFPALAWFTLQPLFKK